jgi:acyl-CoA reductase-like NAD-dependent aldehyde dehydrogenase
VTQGLFDAFYLPPGLAEAAETSVQRFGPAHDSVELRLVTVTPAAIGGWIDALWVARAERLARRPAAEIHHVLERVAQRFLDPESAPRRSAAAWLERMGQFSVPMIERALEDTFRPLASGAVSRWVASQIGPPWRSTPRRGRGGIPRQALGPESMLQIYAGNVPGLPVWPFCSALAMKTALLAKTSSMEPVLAPLLARTIAEEDQDLAACIDVVWWNGGCTELDRGGVRDARRCSLGGENAIASTPGRAP